MNPKHTRRNKNVSATVPQKDTDAIKNAQLVVADWRKISLAISELIKQIELLKQQCVSSLSGTDKLLKSIAKAEKMFKDKTDQDKPHDTENNAVEV